MVSAMLQMDPMDEKASRALVILSNDSGCLPIIFTFSNRYFCLIFEAAKIHQLFQNFNRSNENVSVAKC
jgi:hypothetical protein